MEQNTAQTQKFWRSIGNHAELVFEEGAVQTGLYDETQGKNYEQPTVKESLPNDIEDDEAYLISEGPSREIIEFDENQISSKTIQATIKEEAFILDETSNVYLRTSRNGIPDISVTINDSYLKKVSDQEKQEQSNIVLEVMLCEKSSCPQRQKFKILKGGITGCSRKKIHEKNRIQFKGLKFNYNSNPDKNSKLLIALYKINKDRIRSYVQILVSRDIFLIEDGKAITIDTYESLYQYFENFTIDFMERPPTMVKINKNDKHMYHEQISTFQKYLIKKNKKVAHIVYLAFKFPHFVELYFRNDQKSQNMGQQKNLNLLLSDALKQILSEISLAKYSETEKDLVCNHFNPEAKIVLSINVNMRKVRFLMRKDFTRLISIIATEEQPNYEKYEKFHSNKELKEFYLEYYANAIRCKSPPIENIHKPHAVSPPPPHQLVSPQNNGSMANENLTSEKKNTRKHADEDYQEQEEEEMAELESDESQNYSLSEKKVKKTTKKSEIRKHQTHYSGVNSKEIKYPTRNKTRQLENEDEDDKKGILNRKNKEKELLQQQQQQQIKKPGQPGMPGMFMGGMPGTMPFQIVNPQNPQIPAMSMFPMMQGLQGLQVPGMGMQNPNSKYTDFQLRQTNANQGKTSNPMQMTPQMMGMIPNMFGMPGGMPAPMGGMMGQPLGMFNPTAIMQQQPKKEGTSKDGKDEQPNPAMKQPMPAMIPVNMNPAMLGMQGIQGMPPTMSPFGQGMIPAGMTPMAIQGPNGPMMVMMPNMMGQPGQNPTGTTGATQFPQIPGMASFPPGLAFQPGMTPFAMGINPMAPNQTNSQNPNDKNQNPTGIQSNPMMMGMMPQPMNPAMLNQLMQEQNKSFLQKKDQQTPSQMNQNQNQQRQNVQKNATSQFNPLQKNATNDPKNEKKVDKPEGTFPPNMQNIMGMGLPAGLLGGQGQMPQGMMMVPGFPNPQMMQMMQGGGAFGASKDKSDSNQKPTGLPQGMNPQMLGQLGMGFAPMMPGSLPQGLTPEMLQQMSQNPNGAQLMQMGMLPPGFPIPGGQGQNPAQMGQNPQGQQQGQTGMQGMGQMGMQGGQGMGQMNPQNFNEMMRQQQAMQEMMRKNGVFMPGMQGGMAGMQGMPGMQGGIPGMPNMGGMGGMFMPPKKDEEDKK